MNKHVMDVINWRASIVHHLCDIERTLLEKKKSVNFLLGDDLRDTGRLFDLDEVGTDFMEETDRFVDKVSDLCDRINEEVRVYLEGYE